MKLTIEKMVYGGAGLARRTEDGGGAVLVPFALPGEVVEAGVTETRNGVASASLLQVIAPSEARVQPGCVHFGECGGCQYQHAGYAAQIEIKTGILRETLERAGLAALPAIQAHASEPWRYRNRIRVRVEWVEGEPRVGYSRRGSNEFLPIVECPISAPLLWRACEALLQIARESTAAGRWFQSVAEVEFFIDDKERKLQMTGFVRRDQTGFSLVCERMQELVPELVGAGTVLLAVGDGQRRAQRPRVLSSWGVPGLSYRVGGEDYWVSRGGFFQVNRFLLDELVAVVTAGRKGAVAWDLYAGVGLFSRVLSRCFERVVAVEAAGEDLSNTFKGAGRQAVATTAAEFLRGAVLQRERPALIVVDPPRAGMGDEVCALLARVAAPEMVYVSCDPATLARDLKNLMGAGYETVELHMMDLFPQTFHLETVAILRR